VGDDVSAVAGAERRARASLSFLAEPGEPALGALLKSCRPGEILDAVLSGKEPRAALPAAVGGVPGLARAFGRWRARAGRIPSSARLEAWERRGMRLVCPGDPEWPTQLDVLGDARPLVLWVQGSADLRFACLRSVSVVGARAATGYGQHVAIQMAAALAERGWCVISGGAYITKTLSACTLGSLGRWTEDPRSGRRRCLPPSHGNRGRNNPSFPSWGEDSGQHAVAHPARLFDLAGHLDGKRGVRFEPLISCLNLSRRAAQVRI
jgi:DNA recombination-mediator protein A